MNKLKALCKALVASPIVVKALHTFWQAFAAVWLSTGFKLDKVAIVAALAAGLSAVKSVIVTGVKVSKS